MKKIVLLCAIVPIFSLACTNENGSLYLSEINQYLEMGECEKADSVYTLYKEKTGIRDVEAELGIMFCSLEDVVIEIALPEENMESTSSADKNNDLIGIWGLQEVQIPIDEEFEEGETFEEMNQLDISDNDITIHGFGVESWKYSIYEDSILILSRRNLTDEFIIVQNDKNRLVLATGKTLYGRMQFVFVPINERVFPIRKSKHMMRRYADTNPVVHRLSDFAINQSTSPDAIAYNFVNAILYGDYNKMLTYMENGFKEQITNSDKDELDKYFSTPGKLNIRSWLPALSKGYEIAVVYVQDEGHWDRGQEVKKVYVKCVRSSEIDKKGFQDISLYEYETNVKVLVIRQPDNKWEVVGFK